MDLLGTGQSCLSSGFLCLVYGLHEHMVLILHDSVGLLFMHINPVFVLLNEFFFFHWELLSNFIEMPFHN